MPEQLATIEKKRHSLAHLLAAAVMEIYPNALPTLGPAIDTGFYYDFDFGAGSKVSDKELPKIEKKMREILESWKTFEKKELTEEEAKKIFATNQYKLELIEEIAKKGEVLTVYKSGEFQDLCRGGHVDSVRDIKPDSFKLSRVAGAYWRGDEKNTMLTRIYGLAFDTEDDLSKYIVLQEEARKRDHKRLGKELGLFIFSDLVGPGLPIFTFKGAILRREIVNFSNDLQREIGYQEVHTPNINKAELFRVSGHYDKYKEDMFRVISNYTEEEYYLKPMNCPQHTQIYSSEARSYRDLPIRIADFANLYRDERPGQLSGLTRLRSFCQDDGHAFCREDQIKDEFNSVLGVINKALIAYKMKYKIRLSLWDPEHPEKYLGEPKVWEKAQKMLENILIENNIDYFIGVGEAAFYGPKMDIITTDSLGREWQLSTIQIDFQMPKRFGLKYIDKDGKEKAPIMIHRALIGSPERFMGILIEHYNGAFPLWIAPVQIKIVPVKDDHFEYAFQVSNKLKERGLRIDCDMSNNGMGKKIRDAKNNKIPYVVIVGDREISENKISVESRDTGTIGQITLEEFIDKVQEEIERKSL